MQGIIHNTHFTFWKAEAQFQRLACGHLCRDPCLAASQKPVVMVESFWNHLQT